MLCEWVVLSKGRRNGRSDLRRNNGMEFQWRKKEARVGDHWRVTLLSTRAPAPEGEAGGPMGINMRC